MNPEEFEKALAVIPPEEKGYFHKWFIAFQYTAEWEQFKPMGTGMSPR